MNRRHLIQKMSSSILALGATTILPNCATTTGGGSRVIATKENPFVNSLGMKFVPVPGTKVLFCTTETTVAQYKAAGMGYDSPEFPQAGNHPAVNMTWNEVKAWCAWLSAKEGRVYRPPTDAEWQSAVGDSLYPWGPGWPPPKDAGNYAGEELLGCSESEKKLFVKGTYLIKGFRDEYKFTSPVGSYTGNAYGIHDLGGNVSECIPKDYPMMKDSCGVLGGAWNYSNAHDMKSTSRIFTISEDGNNHKGFRCVLVQN